MHRSSYLVCCLSASVAAIGLAAVQSHRSASTDVGHRHLDLMNIDDGLDGSNGSGVSDALAGADNNAMMSYNDNAVFDAGATRITGGEGADAK